MLYASFLLAKPMPITFSTHSQHDTGSMAQTGVTSAYFLSFLRKIRYGYNIIYGVFFPQFDDLEHEKQYTSQEWYQGKV
jgi:hypothetical protein